ncbi:MAG TPA: non-ribosomal peptide synthetase [Acidobacteriota bacterium]|nr:non-ribosomal peptide synthetase [Acidobacteriota bacterium]
MARQLEKQRRDRSDKRMHLDPKKALQSLTACFEEQVLRHGGRVAVKDRCHFLTYDQLNRAANRLAHAILSVIGAGNEPIALLFPQGTALLTANVAVLKTGRPFVQIDYQLPRQRASRLIQDAGAKLIITDGERYASACTLARKDRFVINLETLNQDLADTNPGVSVAPTAIAYINYTSGSTGEPKGVVSDHGSELHSIRVKANALGITPDDRISLLRSNNVGATSDALLGLLNGATLCPLELKESGLAGLSDWLIEEDVTVFTCVASVFRYCVRTLAASRRFSRIRLVHVGGEAVYRSDVALFKKHFADGCLLVNRLGISETKTVTYFFIDKNTQVAEPIVPVGYPLDGYEITVLDDRGQAVDVNRVGEIAVKSRFLAFGYWRRPDMTREKFLADGAGGDSRVYLSGDLGYLRPDGCLVHVGRKDFQTKIRGHRVELAEVESALLDITGIEQAIAVAHDKGDNGTLVIAYVVPHDGAIITASRLRARLQEILPNYMIPASFVLLQKLPLTASGKIDRRALPLPPRSRGQLENPWVGPRSAVEEVLARLWGEVLQLEEIGIADDLNQLGGDSLLAAQIVTRVNDIFLPAQRVKTLFATPTVAALAEFITSQERSPGDSERIAAAVLQVAAMSADAVAKAVEQNRDERDDG